MIKSSKLGGSAGLSTGDIVETTRTTTEDGKALLPLKEEPRLLTASEQVANPLLLAELPTGIARTRPASFNKGPALALSVGGYGRRFACDASATTCYYMDNSAGKDVMKFDAANGEVLLSTFTSGSSDYIECSSDGQTVAVAGIASAQGILKFSSNGGVTFQDLVTSATSTATYKGLAVSQDGTKMATILDNNTGSHQLYYWDNLPANTTPTVVNIEANLLAARPELNTYVTLLEGIQFADDLSYFVLACYSIATKQGGIYKVTGNGTVFEKISNPIDDLGWVDGGASAARVAVDPFNDNNMLIWPSVTQFSNMFYTNDGGINWKVLPYIPVAVQGTTNVTGTYSTFDGYLPEVSNGYALLPMLDRGYVILDMTKDTITTLPLVYNFVDYLAAKWNIARTELGLATMVSGNDYLNWGEIYTVGKALPAKPTAFTHHKIVGDAQ